MLYSIFLSILLSLQVLTSQAERPNSPTFTQETNHETTTEKAEASWKPLPETTAHPTRPTPSTFPPNTGHVTTSEETGHGSLPPDQTEEHPGKPVLPEICSYVIGGSTGTVESPYYPRHYPDHIKCRWNIQSSYMPHVLIFKDFDVEASAGCMNDALDIYIGGKHFGPYCGSYVPTIFNFSGSANVTFKSDYSRTGRGFKAIFMPGEQYKPDNQSTPAQSPSITDMWKPENTSDSGHGSLPPDHTEEHPGTPVLPEICSYVIGGSTGTVESPYYPRHYPDHLNCRWNIQSSDMPHVLFFKDFDVEASAGCMNDALDIYIGGEHFGPYCGSHAPTIFNFSRSVDITFKSDYSRAGRGFRAIFMPGDQYKPDIQSTPAQSPSNTDMWRPETTSDSGHGSLPPDHTEDHPGEPVFGHGSLPPDHTEAQSPSATDMWGPETTFDSGRGSLPPDHTEEHPGAPVLPGICSYVIGASTGTVESPYYPRHYPDHIKCRWNIQSSYMPHVLIFKDFDVEASAGCMNDALDIYIGGEHFGPYCGSYAPTIFNFSRSVDITFKSDYSRAGRGFRAIFMPGDQYKPDIQSTPAQSPSNTDVWRPETTTSGSGHESVTTDHSEKHPGIPVFQTSGSTEQYRPENTTETGSWAPHPTPSCNTVIAGLQGTIETPNYPKHYYNNLHCKYTIFKPMVPSVLVFVSFDVESGVNCRFDAVNVYVGDKKHGPFCGICYEKDIYFNETVIITFDTDSSVRRKGFRADFMPASEYFPGLRPSPGSGSSGSSMSTEGGYESYTTDEQHWQPNDATSTHKPRTPSSTPGWEDETTSSANHPWTSSAPNWGHVTTTTSGNHDTNYPSTP